MIRINSAPATVTALAIRQTFSITSGTNNSQRQTPNNSTHEIGRKYFRQVIITWSIRSRGSDQRIHIMTNTRNPPLAMNTIRLSTCPAHPSRSDGSNGNSPVCQPPRNRMAAAPLTANMLAYSAMKKNDHLSPLYSVWNPATSSLSASARSNGARLQLAVATMKKITNATIVNGSWNTFQFQKNPVCCTPIVLRLSVPATITGINTHIDRGTS